MSEFTLTLLPLVSNNPIGTQHTVTATFTDFSGPVQNIFITFNVSGTNSFGAGVFTNVNGIAEFTYTDINGPGSDTITATAIVNESTFIATVTKNWFVPIICVFPGALVDTSNGLVPIENIRKNDIILDENNQEIEVINNVQTKYGYKGFTKFSKNCFGSNIPNNDIYITDGHPIKIPDCHGEIIVEDLVNNQNIIRQVGFIPETYSLITKNRTFVKINNLLVCTWSKQRFENFAKNEDLIHYKLL